MNTNVFQFSYTSAFVKFYLRVSSSASALKRIQDKTTTTERIKPSIKFNANTFADVYCSNVLNFPLSFRNELENSRLEAVEIENKTTSRKRFYWWF